MVRRYKWGCIWGAVTRGQWTATISSFPIRKFRPSKRNTRKHSTDAQPDAKRSLLFHDSTTSLHLLSLNTLSLIIIIFFYNATFLLVLITLGSQGCVIMKWLDVFPIKSICWSFYGIFLHIFQAKGHFIYLFFCLSHNSQSLFND